MREVTFRPLPHIGPGVGAPRTEPLDVFLVHLPYRLADGVPSLDALNALLRSGTVDAGMSGGAVWKPFEIDETEYAEVVAALQRRGSNYHEWLLSIEEERHGLPIEEHRRLWQRVRRAQSALDSAQRVGDPEPLRRSLDQYKRASRDLRVWTSEQMEGVPADEHRRRLKEIDALQDLLYEALERGSNEEAREWKRRLTNEQREYENFLARSSKSAP